MVHPTLLLSFKVQVCFILTNNSRICCFRVCNEHYKLLLINVSDNLFLLTYPTGCLPISCLLILLKLSFSSLIYYNHSLNSIILPFIYLTMSYSHLLILLAILVSSLIKNLSFAQHISTISKSCFYNIRDLRRIRNTIDQVTACTIATFDYC